MEIEKYLAYLGQSAWGKTIFVLSPYKQDEVF